MKTSKESLGAAIWRYDLYPYILVEEFNEVKDNGLVYVPSYQGTFRPIYVTSVDHGKQIKTKLENLKKKRNAKLKTVKDIYQVELEELLSNEKIPIKK